MTTKFQVKNKKIFVIALISCVLGFCSMSLAEDLNSECEKLKVKLPKTDTKTYAPITSFGNWHVYVAPKVCWITAISSEYVSDKIHSDSSCLAPTKMSLSYYREKRSDVPQVSIRTDFSLSEKGVQLFLNKAQNYVFWAKQNIAWASIKDDSTITKALLNHPNFSMFYSLGGKAKKIRMERFNNYGFRRAMGTLNIECPFLGLMAQGMTPYSFKTAYLKD